jgi:nitroimidazol reductase NimA-like FMN-containing flavoprotein (pyridoxamine 5'-phosphate oxidase superfamily)
MRCVTSPAISPGATDRRVEAFVLPDGTFGPARAPTARRILGAMAVDRNGFEVLSHDECHALLAGSTLGRVGLSVRALPVVLPVNYGVLGGDVVFLTAEGTKLARAADNAIVAFEVDGGGDAGMPWSVLVVGRSEVIVDPGERAAAERTVPVSWLRGVATQTVRVRADVVTGRRAVTPSPGRDDPREAGAAGGSTLDGEHPADFVRSCGEVPQPATLGSSLPGVRDTDAVVDHP